MANKTGGLGVPFFASEPLLLAYNFEIQLKKRRIALRDYIVASVESNWQLIEFTSRPFPTFISPIEHCFFLCFLFVSPF